MTSVVLLGCDGSTWDLTSGTSGADLQSGLGGLHLPPVAHQWTKSARSSGRQWRGATLDSRTFTMTVSVGDSTAPGRTGADWRTLDGQFWQALAVDATSQLVVNGTRTLTFRLDAGNEAYSSTTDPSLAGQATYVIDCIADRPEWVGAPVTSTFNFVATATDNYYGSTAGLGPPFYIGASSLFDTASASNPGDLPAYPTWAITGPVTTATVGILGRTVTLPFPVFANQTVYIDTAAQAITDDQGSNLWPLMGYTPVDFAPIPPGDEVPVAVGMDGAAAGSSVSVTVTPLYRRAW